LQGRDGWTAVDAYHALFWVYAVAGIVNVILTLLLSKSCELQNKDIYMQVPQEENDAAIDQSTHQPIPGTVSTPSSATTWPSRLRLWFTSSLANISASTRSVMYKLWFCLFVDSLADGMVPYSLTNYYIDNKFHPSKSTLGDIQSMAYFLGAIGSSFAGPLARRLGLINTIGVNVMAMSSLKTE